MKYDILCFHTRWNKQELSHVMGGIEDGTKYITILRDPVDVLESVWGFYSFDNKFGMSLGDSTN